MNMRKELLEEFEVPLAIKDNHRNVVSIVWRTDEARNVLGDDVFEKGSFARARHSKYDALHNPDIVGPKPRLFIHVIAQRNRVLVPRGFDGPLILSRTDDERRALSPPSAHRVVPQYGRHDCSRNDKQVESRFDHLVSPNVKSGHSEVKQ
jgi:hypothetical protein